MPTTDIDGEVANEGGLADDAVPVAANARVLDLAGLQVLSLEELRRRWTSACGIHPLPRLSRELMVRGIAYRMQERARGGLSKTVLRKLERIARGGSGSNRASTNNGSPSFARAGTRLVREWQGSLHEVVVLEKGFLWNGSTYRSLSEIARLITGTRWSGPRFCGLKQMEAKADG
ncbi:MAG: DUF2924 domain-containing protein [Thermomicrobiales bacterium]